jgi:arylsulfatase A-like enzyme
MATRRPNILLVLADDMGFSDIGCYGGEIDTPNLDRLARNGVRFSQFYNAGRCSPSRASLLTGLHPHQAGIGVLTKNDAARGGYAGSLNRACVTIPEVLKQVGYVTCASGKWHLASDVARPNDAWPTRRGFDEFYGTLLGSCSYFQPGSLTCGEANVEAEATGDFYYTDAITDHACDFIRRSGAGTNPFLLYVAYTAPHWPLHARDEDIAKYCGRFDEGWDVLRERRIERLHASGVLGASAALSARDPTQPAWTDVEDKAWQSRRMEVYAAQIDRMDQGIGRMRGTAAAGWRRRRFQEQPPASAKAAPAQRSHAASGQRTVHHAGRRRHVCKLWPGLGQPVERAVPFLQTLDARRWRRHAADRALARRRSG